MSVVIKPPTPIPDADKRTVFLAGSIEMGKAVDWQARVTRDLSDDDVVIFNPRRDDWDSSWAQRADNDRFREQVLWELEALERADVIALCFMPVTMSPISLLEFGLHARKGNVVVLCPEGYWRKGNVDVTAAKYGVPVFDSYDPWLAEIKRRLREGVKP